MPKIKFLAYVRRTAGVENIEVNESNLTIKEVLEFVCEQYPQLTELILDDVPEVSFIHGEKNLLIPNDLILPFTEDLTIGPIVAGG